jgi:hypothetical protein
VEFVHELLALPRTAMGWHWPLKARQLLAVLFVGALVGAAAWVLVAVLRAFA